jgi:hypothetical protein
MAPAFRPHQTPASPRRKFAPGERTTMAGTGRRFCHRRPLGYITLLVCGRPELLLHCGAPPTCDIINYHKGHMVPTKQYPSASLPKSAYVLPAVWSCLKRLVPKAQCLNASQKSRRRGSDDATVRCRCDIRQSPQRGTSRKFPADSLPTPFYGPETAPKFPARRLGQIVSKLLVYNIFLSMRWAIFRHQTEFFPCGQGNAAGSGMTRWASTRRDKVCEYCGPWLDRG